MADIGGAMRLAEPPHAGAMPLGVGPTRELLLVAPMPAVPTVAIAR